jgi:molybdate/tungstate transport system ATP-binding protein
MIRVDGLSRAWGDFTLKNISLEVNGSEYFVILGPCGSGKTLLLETIAGLYTINQGRVRIRERDVTALPPERRSVGLVYQQYALFPHLSVRTNIGFGLRYTKLGKAERETRIDEMIELFGIQDLAGRRTPSSLSGGEAQKVALARALAIRPEVLLLDEPLSSLDQRAREKVIAILPRITEELGVPVIHVTHHYSEATALADRVGIMRDGRLEQVGGVAEVFRHPANAFVADFLGVSNVMRAAIRGTEEGSAVVELPGGVTLRSANPNGLQGDVALCVRPDDILVTTAPDERPNTLAGRLAGLRDLGFTTVLDVDTATGRFEVTLPESVVAGMRLTIGDTVRLELPADRLHLMALDEDSRP